MRLLNYMKLRTALLILSLSIVIISCLNADDRRKIMSTILEVYIENYVANDTCMYKACTNVSTLCIKSAEGYSVSDSDWKLADSSVSKAFQKNNTAVNACVAICISDIIYNFNTHNPHYDNLRQLKTTNNFVMENVIKVAKESGHSQDTDVIIAMKSKLQGIGY